MHGTNEYPFLIERQGISVLPVTSLGLAHKISDQRISSGVSGLDDMLEGQGFYRGSSILVTGTAGTGKTSLAAHVVDSACRRGENCLYFSFEESPDQILRNMRSIGIDLGRWIKKGLLRIHATRPTAHGLEMHLAEMHRFIDEHKPQVVVLDPLTSLMSGGVQDGNDVTNMVLRVIDRLKQLGTTGFFTALTSGSDAIEATQVNVSSLVDTWLLLRDVESDGERNRVLYVLKSRGMAHSNQVREFLMTKQGVELREAYLGPGRCFNGVGATGPGSSRAWPRKPCKSIKATTACAPWTGSSAPPTLKSLLWRPRKTGSPASWMASLRKIRTGAIPRWNSEPRWLGAAKLDRRKRPAQGYNGEETFVPAETRIRIAIVCRGADSAVAPGVCQLDEDLRGVPRGKIHHRGYRFAGETAIGKG